MKYLKKDIENSLLTLAKIYTPGAEIGMIMQSVSASGMTRRVTLHCTCEDQILDITYSMATVIGYPKLSIRQGRYMMTFTGCGYDIGDHIADYMDRAGMIRPHFRWI